MDYYALRHVCHFIELDGTTVGCCHLTGEHGGRCFCCDGQAGEGVHPIGRARELCPYPNCQAHHRDDSEGCGA